ncbi:copper chaperone for superoxide dismutase [Athene noctua]|uniref:copper chaperone for superoxide dismutase n=1 Tax=Athene noctua TaxID=126797 RepID=UPI003EBFFC7D
MAAPGPSCRLEFAVQMRCQSCAEAVRAALRGAPDVRLLELRLDAQTVLVETTAAAERVREVLEASGRRAVLKGMGGPDDASPGAAAVAALAGAGGVRGLVRFLQVSPGRCLVDGAVEGLPPGPHGLHVHEFGDLSHPCDSCGGHFNPDGESHGGPQDRHRHVGDLGNIWADAEGRASFRLEDSRLKVWDIIGRSVVVDAGEDDLGRGSHPLSRVTGNSGPGLACGVVARAAGLFQNPKKICSCDGRTLWEERDRAAAATGPVATAGPKVATSPTAAPGPTAAPAPHL